MAEVTVLVTNPGAELYGSDRMLVESVRAFAGRGWRVVVTLPAPGPLAAALVDAGADEVTVCPTPVLRRAVLSPRGAVGLARVALRSLRPATALLRRVRPDVVYVSTVTTPAWLLLARLARVPVVAHVHEAESSVPRLVRTGLSAPLLLARRVLVNSQFALGVVQGSVPSLGRRCEVVYNGVAGPPVVTAAREQLDGQVQLLYVGRLSARKGVRDVVDAVAVLASRGVDAHLRLVGASFAGNESYDEELRRAVEGAGLQARVTFCGFDPDVWPHLARADVAVVPSRLDEPFGNTAVEALLAARPLVVTATSGLLEASALARSAHRVPPGDVEALAGAVHEVVTDWSAQRQLAADDAVRYAEAFSPAAYRTAVAGAVAACVPPHRRA
ncbi:glycosyltransferase family 4 protein [Pseudokineococcus sp. 1T1Z-3]|uniref:glycosyltransferase family 4 protein n=1 Tax=Pseudokineococcus sp. 1T1Z-3 TaxID=3132745 RepID=UPI0030AF2867